MGVAGKEGDRGSPKALLSQILLEVQRMSFAPICELLLRFLPRQEAEGNSLCL